MNFKRILLNIILFIFLFATVSGGLSHAATATYTYDNLNRLTKVDYGNGTTTEYTYDAAGNRITLLTIDATPPSNPTETSGYSSPLKLTPLTSDNWYNYPAPYFDWSGASDSSGIAGYYVYFGPSSTADPVTAGAYQISSSYTVSTALISDTTYYLLIKAKDNPGNAATSAYTAFIYNYDNIPPETTITGQPSTLTNSTSAGFDFVSTESGSSFQCQLDSGGWSFCASPKSYTELTEGEHTFYVRATDIAGNTDMSPASYSWTIDTTPPSNPSGASGYSNSSKTTILASGDWYNYSAPYFEWSDASDSSGISGYYVYFGPSPTTDPVTEGAYQTSTNYTVSATLTSDTTYYLLIKAKDNAGNAAVNAYTAFAYHFDNTPPDTAITSQPSSLTNSTSASFSFTSTEAGSSFECQLDGGGWSACTSPGSYTGLAEGSHTFSVRATDLAGNTDQAPASYSWTVDTTAPATFITSQPPDPTNAASAVFDFMSLEDGATFECRMDGEAYSSCTSPKSYTELGEEEHTFHVRATDAAGNTDGTPASYTWIVDLTSPVLTLSTLSDGAATNNSVLNIAGTVTDNTGIQGLVINGDEVTVNGDGSFSHAIELAEGFNAITTIATDLAGNETADVRGITLDLTAPVLDIAAPADNSKTADSVIEVTGTIGESATVEIRHNDGVAQAASITGNTFTANLNLTAGINTIEVTATDPAGNESTQKRTVIYDDTSPSLEVTNPDQDIKTNQSSIVIRGTVSDTLTTVNITINVDSDIFTPQVTDGQFEQTVSFTVEKTYQIIITATDEVGNTATVQRNIIYDVTGPAFDVVVTTPTNDSSQTISGGREENTTITVSSATATIGPVTYPTDTTWSVTISGMVEGSNALTITARDAAGNESTVIKEIILDTTAPDTSITGQPSDPTGSTSATFSFASTEAASTFECQMDGGGYSACTSPVSYSDFEEGTHIFEVKATDAAGNMDLTPASYSWTIDLTLPLLTINPVISPTNLISQIISGIVEAGATVSVVTDTIASDGAATVTGTQWSYTITGLAEGVNNITVTATDTAGNTATAISSIILDTTAPDTSITVQPTNLTNSPSASFSFVSTEPGSTFECQLDSGGWSACTSPKSYTGLAEGSHTFQVRATDLAGNTDSTPASYSWTIDITAPAGSITINDGAGYTSSLSVTLTLTCADSSGCSEMQFSNNGTTWSSSEVYATSKSWTLSTGEEAKTVYVKFKDEGGNWSTVYSDTIILDTTAPIITSATSSTPNGYYKEGDSINISVIFTESIASSGLTITLNSGALLGTGLLTNVSGYSGTYTVEAGQNSADLTITSVTGTITDRANNSTINPLILSGQNIADTKAIVIDTTAPVINAGEDRTANATVTQTAAATDANAMTYSWTKQAGPGIVTFGTSTALSTTLSADSDGTYTLRLTATDASGNSAHNEMVLVWDTVAPATFITSQPSDPTNATSAGFGFMSLEDGATFKCRMDGEAYSPCTSPKTYTGLGEGEHTFQVRATDAAGNPDETPAGYTWAIDLTAPLLTLSTLSDGAATNNPVLNIAGTVTDNTGIQGLVINGDEIAVSSDGSFSHAVQLDAGLNTITTVVTDLAGNETTDTRVITLDLTAPALAITSPADNSKTAVSVITVTGTIDESAAVEIRLNNGDAQAASLTGNTFTATLTLIAGINTIGITATDLAGNKATQKRTVTYDDTSPSLEVTSPNQDIKTNQSSMVIKGAVSDTLTAVDVTIKVDDDTFTPPVTDGQFEQAVTFNSEKIYQITITATDEAGNTTIVQRNIIYDITGPSFDVVVTTPTNDSSQAISGSREENTTIMVSSATVTIGAVTYPTATAWSVNISGMVEGNNAITIIAHDAAGNETMVMKEIALDTIVPDTSITAQPPSLTNSTSASFNFTSTEAGSTFQCQLDGGDYSACASPISYSGLAEGSHTFETGATDSAGNTDASHASYTWTIDLTPPSVTISPVTSLTNFISQAITGTVEAGATVNVMTDTIASDGAATVTGTLWRYTITGLIEGLNNITVSATDAAGNTATATSSITLDITAPDTSITARPSNPTNSISANFSFTSTETGSTFQCQIDSGGYSSCSSPKSYTGLADGSHTFFVTATDPAGNTDPTPASYSWTVDTTAPDIAVTPVTLPFGNVNVDSSSERTVSVRNDGNANLTIGTITDLSSPFSKVLDNCSGQTFAPSTGCTIRVRFAPVSTGAFNSTFDVPSNDPDENPVTISLTGTGANVGSPDITVLPSLDLSFPNISVAVTADQTVTIKNDGTTDLTISMVTSPLAPFSIVAGENNCANYTLAPNQSCTIKVRFAPVASGTFNSSFDVPSNDPDENPVTINLSGSATPGTNNPPTKPNLAEPANGAAGMPTTLTLKWDKSTDPEGDPITYKLYMGTDPSFANVNPMIVASISNKSNSAMAFRYSMGMFGLFGIIAIGGLSKNRRRIGFLIVTVIFVGGLLLSSCGSGGGTSGDNSNNSDKKDYVSYTANLQPDTTYYWKVVADDGNGGTTESDTYSFTTGR